MKDAGLYSFPARVILVIHFAFVVFVVLGFVLILLGLLARWSSEALRLEVDAFKGPESLGRSRFLPFGYK
jgi:hypothetical protein